MRRLFGLIALAFISFTCGSLSSERVNASIPRKASMAGCTPTAFNPNRQATITSLCDAIASLQAQPRTLHAFIETAGKMDIDFNTGIATKDYSSLGQLVFVYMPFSDTTSNTITPTGPITVGHFGNFEAATFSIQGSKLVMKMPRPGTGGTYTYSATIFYY